LLCSAAGWRRLGSDRKEGRRKDFFFEKKKQKTFVPCDPRQSQRERKSPKVFWFFFSKKNCFLAFSSDAERMRGWAGFS
jgi:hypothetical protein